MKTTDTNIPQNCGECEFHIAKGCYVYCEKVKGRIGTTVACYERMKNCPFDKKGKV